MLTSDTYRELKFFLKLTASVSCLPIRFNSKSQLIEDIPPLRKPVYFLMVSILFLRTNYHFASLIKAFWYGVSSIADTAVEWFFATCLLTSLATQLGLYLGRDALTNHFNQLFRANRMLGDELLIAEAKSKGRHPRTGKKYNDGCTLWMRIFTLTAYVSPIFFGLFFLTKPNSRLYFYFLLPPEWKWAKSLYCVWETYQYYWNCPCLYFNVYISLLYTKTCTFWLTQMS